MLRLIVAKRRGPVVLNLPLTHSSRHLNNLEEVKPWKLIALSVKPNEK